MDAEAYSPGCWAADLDTWGVPGASQVHGGCWALSRDQLAAALFGLIVAVCLLALLLRA